MSKLLKFQSFNGEETLSKVVTICIGSGRFLRAVLVPAVEKLGGVIIAQPRGESFVHSLVKNNGVYEVETVRTDGSVEISYHRVEACGSLSNIEARQSFVDLPKRLNSLRVVGVGITEAGFNEQNSSISDLAALLYSIFKNDNSRHISILNTDNVSSNGYKLKELITKRPVVTENADFAKWLDLSVTFHNTMVDRITSHRDGDEIVPRAEPLPSKALVIEDLDRRLPNGFRNLSNMGVHICYHEHELQELINAKLLIANATHTCIAYGMALSWFPGTSACINNKQFIKLIDGIFWQDIHPTFAEGPERKHAEKTYIEWRSRLQHPNFEMSTFFVCQNATQKLCIRILPTLKTLIELEIEPTALLAYSVAATLRFLTPSSFQENRLFVGKLPSVFENENVKLKSSRQIYAGALTFDFSLGEYQFRNESDVSFPLRLQEIASNRKSSTVLDLLADLFSLDLSRCGQLWNSWLNKVNQLYFRMLEDELNGFDHLKTLNRVIEEFHWINESEVREIVTQVVNDTPVIDVHTHLFPQSHGNLLLFGIDELLTYHYLVAEYFMTAPLSIIPEEFYKLSKLEQANLIWEQLFVKRSPISEACQGVITTLNEFGLGRFVRSRNLEEIRKWVERFTADDYVDKVFQLANVKYVVMTNIPYDPVESRVWLKTQDRSKLTNKHFRSALRIDLFLQANWKPIADILEAEGFESTKPGLMQYLERWIEIMKPEYLMASIPTDFVYRKIFYTVLCIDQGEFLI